MKVGDYARTNKGIAKYLGLGRDVLKHETNKNTYEHYYSQHLFDNYIFNVGHDYGDTLTYDEFNNIDKLGKVKETITDLIEVGDILKVNEFKDVYTIYEVEMFRNPYTNENYLGIRSDIVKKPKRLYEIPLVNLSIVTHEQFSQMEYRIGE